MASIGAVQVQGRDIGAVEATPAAPAAGHAGKLVNATRLKSKVGGGLV